jgi:Na+/H+ antiporter NhaD/arsenite permease-like protein
MTIVELIDAHDGFEVITEKINTRSKKKLLLLISLIAFFLSAILDNLTTTIVMISLISKLMAGREDRMFFSGMVVIAANAGGSFSPIGDVTTTMLWIGGQVTTGGILSTVLPAALVCLFVPMFFISRLLKGEVIQPLTPHKEFQRRSTPAERKAVLWVGVACLLFVPVFKSITHLPPFMGMLCALGIMWMITELIHSGKDEIDKDRFSVNYALRKIDTPSILFFLGILISVAALDATGLLKGFADKLTGWIGNENMIVMLIGVISSVVDNVPLVAATQGMYSLSQYPSDHYFWLFLAYCTGTGGSTLIIGSAAGVAAMGIAKIDFFWYVKKITPWALLGYLAGAMAFLLQKTMTGGF